MTKLKLDKDRLIPVATFLMVATMVVASWQ